MRWTDVGIAVFVVMIWGVNFVSIRVGVSEFPPFFLLVLRFIIVSLLTLPWLIRFKVSDLPLLLLLALINGVGYFALVFLAMKGLSASEAVILVQLQVPISVVLAHFFHKDRMSWPMVLGILIALVGVIVTVGMPRHFGTIESVALLLISALFWACGSLLMRRMKHIHPFTINGTLCLFALLPMYGLSLYLEPHAAHSLLTANWKGWVALGFTSLLSSIVAYSLWMYLLGKYRINQVTPITLIEPAFGVLAGVVLLGEPLFPHTIIGALICVGGVYLVFRNQKNTA